MRRAGRGQEGRTVLGQGPAGGWVQARHEGAICPERESAETRAQAQTCALRLIVPSLSVGSARLPGFPLVRLSQHGLRRNYIVSRDSISSEQAVSFTPGPAPPPPSSSSLFPVVPAFPAGPRRQRPPVCAAALPGRPLPPDLALTHSTGPRPAARGDGVGVGLGLARP